MPKRLCLARKQVTRSPKGLKHSKKSCNTRLKDNKLNDNQLCNSLCSNKYAPSISSPTDNFTHSTFSSTNNYTTTSTDTYICGVG